MTVPAALNVGKLWVKKGIKYVSIGRDSFFTFILFKTVKVVI